MSCCLLPYAVADGPHNMAADEVLLEAALGGIASFRLYGWSPATVSLGYFQRERLRHGSAASASLPYVRRPSGGGALVHHHEVTYALALPAGAPWHTKESWLCRMHTIVAQALAELGVRASACGTADGQRFGGFLCFQHVTAGDLLIGSAKVLGSAQRRHKGALLQHGGILLAASPYAPELPGIAELTGCTLDVDETCRAVLDSLHRMTGWDLQPGDWTAAQRDRIEELVKIKYGQDRWNDRR